MASRIYRGTGLSCHPKLPVHRFRASPPGCAEQQKRCRNSFDKGAQSAREEVRIKDLTSRRLACRVCVSSRCCC